MIKDQGIFVHSNDIKMVHCQSSYDIFYKDELITSWQNVYLNTNECQSYYGFAPGCHRADIFFNYITNLN